MIKQDVTFVIFVSLILVIFIYKTKKVHKIEDNIYNNNINMITKLYYLSPNIRKVFGNNFYTNEVPGDNSCFYHSVLYCISTDYKKANTQEKKLLVQDLRTILAEHVTQEYYDKEFSGFINKNTLIHNLQNYGVWATITEWKVVVDYMKINIIIFRQSTDSIYCGWGIDNFNPSYKTIFILNIGDYHYDPIIYYNEYKLQSIFYSSSSIISDIINYGKNFCNKQN